VGSVPVQSNPISPEKEAAIRSRLADILASPEFRASQKCQSFLKYVVEEALAGRQEALKERVIGADVFGRAPGFETAGDSIVRVKATEVRRRLARYYQGQPGPGVRIELPTGSYVPVFPIEDGVQVVATVAPAAEVAEGPLLSRRAMWGAGGVGAVAVAAVAVWRQRAAVTALDRFWGPLLGTAAPVVVCASGGPAISARTTEVLDALRRPVVARVFGSEDFQLSRQAQTSWPTAQAIADVSRMLGTAGKDFELRVADQMSFEQVKTHPIVVIGMFSNPWTIELTRHLRFSFAPTADGQYVVRDATRSEPLRRVAGLYPGDAAIGSAAGPAAGGDGRDIGAGNAGGGGLCDERAALGAVRTDGAGRLGEQEPAGVIGNTDRGRYAESADDYCVSRLVVRGRSSLARC
jgi:hypothetical protein